MTCSLPSQYAQDARRPLSKEAQDARRPQPWVLLLEAEQDRPEFPAKARTVKVVKAGSRKVPA